MQKAQDNAPQGTPAPRVDPSSPTDPPAGSGTMLSGLQALAPGLLDFDPAQLVDKLAALISDDPAAMLRTVAGISRTPTPTSCTASTRASASRSSPPATAGSPATT
jgi:hypothetical protein